MPKHQLSPAKNHFRDSFYERLMFPSKTKIVARNIKRSFHESQKWYFAWDNWWFGIKSDPFLCFLCHIWSLLMPNHQLAPAKYHFCVSWNEHLMFRSETKNVKKIHCKVGWFLEKIHCELEWNSREKFKYSTKNDILLPIAWSLRNGQNLGNTSTENPNCASPFKHTHSRISHNFAIIWSSTETTSSLNDIINFFRIKLWNLLVKNPLCCFGAKRSRHESNDDFLLYGHVKTTGIDWIGYRSICLKSSIACYAWGQFRIQWKILNQSWRLHF